MNIYKNKFVLGGIALLLVAGVMYISGFSFTHKGAQKSMGGKQGKEAHPYYAELEKAHKEMMKMAENPDDSMEGMAMHKEDKRPVIAVLLYDGFALMDAVGPIQVFSSLNDYSVVTVAKQKGEIQAENGTKIIADKSLDEVKTAYMLVVPGGLFGTIAVSKDPQTLAWIRDIDKTTTYTSSVCTGAWILGAADLLKGKEASTHWSGKEYLERFGAKYTGKRYTVDGKYITSAGISAGIDMGLYLVGKMKGDDAAKVVQLTMEYDPQPPYDAGTPQKADQELVKLMTDMMTDHTRWADSQ